MTSWSASVFPPPPRRSRSRSPSRGVYPSRTHLDPAYGQEPYRADWDAYDRDRAWPGYERDRPVYDYGRRGRSRSPSQLEDSMPQCRSLTEYSANMRRLPIQLENDDVHCLPMNETDMTLDLGMRNMVCSKLCLIATSHPP